MLFNLHNKSLDMPSDSAALPGRSTPMAVNPVHFVSGHTIVEPVPAGLQKIVFGLGCFWGAERRFWRLPGVYSTASGYAGGSTRNPTYREVCSGMSGHTEAVLVYFDPQQVSLEQLFAVFWEAHDPTQGMRQGNDIGSQYRSAIYTCDPVQLALATASAAKYQIALREQTYPEITTEIKKLDIFYYAEDYHQQYLAKNPGGYCGLAGTGACYQLDSKSQPTADKQ